MENILINESEARVKIIDFGFSRTVGAKEKLNVFCGTPSYMAPELVSRKPYFPKPADIWALGIMLYKMIAGVFPFTASDEKSLYTKIKNQEVAFPNFFSDNLKKLLKGMLKREANGRLTADKIFKHIW